MSYEFGQVPKLVCFLFNLYSNEVTSLTITGLSNLALIFFIKKFKIIINYFIFLGINKIIIRTKRFFYKFAKKASFSSSFLSSLLLEFLIKKFCLYLVCSFFFFQWQKYSLIKRNFIHIRMAKDFCFLISKYFTYFF